MSLSKVMCGAVIVFNGSVYPHGFRTGNILAAKWVSILDLNVDAALLSNLIDAIFQILHHRIAV